MNDSKTRGLAVACGVVLVLLAPAAPSSAGLLDCLFGPPDNPCSPPPVVVSRTTYMPQTCYRSAIQTVPVTGYRAVVGCDPCTGCAPTCYRPVTTYIRRVQLVPYTTYRMALYNPSVSCPASTYFGYGARCYSGCSVGFGTVSGTILSGGCSSCVAAPQATISPGYATVAPAGSPAMSIAAPGGSASSAAGTTFKDNSGARTQLQRSPTGDQGPEAKPEPKLQPQRMQGTGLNKGQGAGPRIAPFGPPPLDPNDRTTARPIRPAVHHRPAGWTPRHPAAPAKPVIDDGGWRPARD